jgi:hypothetical protein
MCWSSERMHVDTTGTHGPSSVLGSISYVYWRKGGQRKKYFIKVRITEGPSRQNLLRCNQEKKEQNLDVELHVQGRLQEVSVTEYPVPPNFFPQKRKFRHTGPCSAYNVAVKMVVGIWCSKDCRSNFVKRDLTLCRKRPNSVQRELHIVIVVPSYKKILKILVPSYKKKTDDETQVWYLQKTRPIGRTEAKDMRVNGHALAHLFALPEILHIRNSESLVS